MRALLGCAAACLLAALWATPAGAVRPASPGWTAQPAFASPAQFRFPWEARPQKRKPRPKRSARPAKPRADRPAAPGRRNDAKRPAAAAAVDPKDMPLPPLTAPAGLRPRGATQREADGWASLAGQVGEPSVPPLLPPEGPAPAPANVMALLSQIEKPAPPAADDDDAPDLHVPLPPVRPGAPTAGRPRTEDAAPENGPARPGVPLPTPRDDKSAALEPGPPSPPEPPPGPTPPAIPLPVTTHDEDPACGPLADKGFAVAERLPPIDGPGVCGGGPLVLLSGVTRKDGGEIAVKPAATLRCAMAKELADYIREDLAPAAEASGTKLERLAIAGSYMCRGRNGASGGTMSEHGRANAVDISGFGFADGREFGVFASDLPEAFAAAAKTAACAHFDTVLGPGSDGFHESHLHVDLQPRRSKSKLCQWSDPQIAKAKDDKESGGPNAARADDGPDGKDEDKGERDRREKPVDARASARRKTDRADEPLPKGGETP